jgi:hypothetical protein
MYVRIYIYIYIHTYIHTYIYTHNIYAKFSEILLRGLFRERNLHGERLLNLLCVCVYIYIYANFSEILQYIYTYIYTYIYGNFSEFLLSGLFGERNLQRERLPCVLEPGVANVLLTCC